MKTNLRKSKIAIIGHHFSVIGKKLGPCDHSETYISEGFDTCARGRIDAEVCRACGKVLGKKIVR
jgi:hypothetical protein